MNEFFEAAKKKLDKSTEGLGSKEKAMAGAVKEALLDFCRQDEEFAQAVAQGGSFPDCMRAVARGVGQSISDLEVFNRAAQFYYLGARIRLHMTIDLCASVSGEPLQERSTEDDSAAKAQQTKIINLEDFF